MDIDKEKQEAKQAADVLVEWEEKLKTWDHHNKTFKVVLGQISLCA